MFMVLIDKFNGIRVFLSGLDKEFFGAGVAIILNTSLACYVCKISEVPGQLLLVKLLFKNKLFMSILGLYAEVSLAVYFSQANDINSMIAKVVNESLFVVLGGDFNEDGSRKSASFRKCLDLGLVNSLGGSSYVKTPTWANSQDVAKTIDFLFVSSNLANVVVSHNVFNIEKFFDTDHQAVFVELGGLLDFDFKGANEAKWNNFENATSANTVMFSDEFAVSVKFSNLDAMWDVVRKIMVLLANKVFKKKWFKGFDDVFTKESSRYHKLKLLVSKIVKASCKESAVSLDSIGTSAVQNIVNSGAGSGWVCSALCGARKAYYMSKLAESYRAKETTIRAAIDKRMESFEINKSHTIRSVLEHPFHKVILNHLVVDNELVLESNLVNSKFDVIMKDWTKKH
ncbi:hypothetical protein G9A89_011309 [Geosiphon pyriformis]|nr:hypothetical protein G9A89_011309 [Geosiphon pyriformis]